MESIETVCVSLECFVDDIWAVHHTSPPARLLEAEYTLGGLGVYAEVSGGDGDRQSPSRRPDTRNIPTSSTREHKCDKIDTPNRDGSRWCWICDVDSSLRVSFRRRMVIFFR